MKLSDLTVEERKALAQEALAIEKKESIQKTLDRVAYKELVSDKVDQLFPALTKLATLLSEVKTDFYSEFSEAIELKKELYGVKDTQNSHQFMNANSNRRIMLGHNTVDAYDDTVNEGIEKVKAYIASLATDNKSEVLVEAVMKLLSKDQKGSLKPSKVMQLRQMATKSGDADFVDGVEIIEAAYKPTRTKTFIKAEYRDENNEWVSVPLGITEA